VPPDRSIARDAERLIALCERGSTKMFELTTGAEVLGLQSIAETAQLSRRHHGGGGGGVSVRKNVCLITLNGSANGLSILNILNGFGGF
jgi:hypothetical protein